MTARAERVIPGGVSSSLRSLDPPLVFTRGKGGRVWDADGKSYVDFHAAFGPILIGHNDPELAERAVELSRGASLVGLGASPLELQLAEKLREHVPSMEQMLFCGNGSDATYHAIRVARAATGRHLVVKFQGCYHGWHDYLGANVISTPDRVGRIDSTSEGTLPQALDWLRVLPFNDVDALTALMDECGHEIAAVIVEPVIHTIGCVAPTDAFINALRSTTTAAGALLIYDEVVTGFRHHLGGFQAINGVRPDLTTLAKSIGNGTPLAVVGGPADVMEQFNTRLDGRVMYGGTFNGHPQAMATALATIERLERDDRAIHRRLFELGAMMRDGLAAIGAELGLDTQPVNYGSIFVNYFVDHPVSTFVDALDNNADRYIAFHRGMIDKGFLMVPMNLKRNHLMAAHTSDDVSLALEAAREVMIEIAHQPSLSA
jgi:glutamate-1-semialdehyde 2,1-aminomutase